jgi:hypothetical protein
MRETDGESDVDVSTPATRGFLRYPVLRVAEDGRSRRVAYGPSPSTDVGARDAMQYPPVLGTGLNWQLYQRAGVHRARATSRKDAWFHLRLEVTGAQA